MKILCRLTIVQKMYHELAVSYYTVSFISSVRENIIQTKFIIKTRKSYQRRLCWLSMVFCSLPHLILPIMFPLAENFLICTLVSNVSLICVCIGTFLADLSVIHRYRHLSRAKPASLHFKAINASKFIAGVISIPPVLMSAYLIVYLAIFPSDTGSQHLKLVTWIQIATIFAFFGFSLLLTAAMNSKLFFMSIKVLSIPSAAKGSEFAKEIKRRANKKAKLFALLGAQAFIGSAVVIIVVLSQASSAYEISMVYITIFSSSAILNVLSLRLLETFREALRKKAKKKVKRVPPKIPTETKVTQLSSVPYIEPDLKSSEPNDQSDSEDESMSS